VAAIEFVLQISDLISAFYGSDRVLSAS